MTKVMILNCNAPEFKLGNVMQIPFYPSKYCWEQRTYLIYTRRSVYLEGENWYQATRGYSQVFKLLTLGFRGIAIQNLLTFVNNFSYAESLES